MTGDRTAYDRTLPAARRRERGIHYTPTAVVDRLLDQTLEPVLDGCADADEVGRVRVLDPACGTGHFLVAAARRIADRLITSRIEASTAATRAASCCWGADTDPDAVHLARRALPDAHLEVVDGLLHEWGGASFDVVVGNPPFLGRLRRQTAGTRERAAQLRQRFGEAAQAYTDEAVLFLVLATRLARPDGGRVGFVQPLSVLASRDAGAARDEIVARATISCIEELPPETFDAAVHTCAVVLQRPGSAAAAARPWTASLAQAQGIPLIDVVSAGRLGDHATATADFRDEYYGLRGAVVEDGAGPRLITCGLIEPARTTWGRTPTRIHGTRYLAPTVALDAIDARMRAWVVARLVPKVLVATQTRVIEAVADPAGELLPSVPVLSVTGPRLWHIAAVLLAPPVAALARAEHLGTARSPGALKLRAADLLDLPVPADEPSWDQAAAVVEHAHRAMTGDEARGTSLLREAGRIMGRAYGVAADDPVFSWWEEQATRRR